MHNHNVTCSDEKNIADNNLSQSACCGCCSKSSEEVGVGKLDILRLLTSGIILAFAMYYEDSLKNKMGVYGFFVFLLVPYLLCGYSVLKEGITLIFKGDFFNEFTLMTVTTLAAIAIDQIPEAVGVMLFYSIGETVQEVSTIKYRQSIKSLLAEKPDSVNLLIDNKIVITEPESIKIGDLFLVKPGEKVPLDGKVISGNANIDISSLIGESLPVLKKKNDDIYSGSISLDGDLVIEATAIYANSTVAKILEIVEEAANKKSNEERFITRFARYYTPIVFLISLLVAITPPLLFKQVWSEWIYRGLVILVVSCPCALVLSIPLSFFGGIAEASHNGILVKGGKVFSNLLKIKSIIFDKTGTLTKGSFSVVKIEPQPGISQEKLLEITAIAESHSNHPIAKSITEMLGSNVNIENVEIREIAGKGVEAKTKMGVILAGNALLLKESQISFTENKSHGIVVYVAKDNKFLGTILLEDTLKNDTGTAIKALKKENKIKNFYMLTGDNEIVAARVAKELNLSAYKSELLPADKVKAFNSLTNGEPAMFVGDGINDAPVLATASVGVAMGGLGSAAAVEVAEVVVLNDSLFKLPVLFKLAKKTHWVVWENIIFALTVKLAFMFLGAAGISSLWEAVFADVGVTLLSVLNAIRLIRV